MKVTIAERLDLFIKVMLRDYTKTKIAEMIEIDLPLLSKFTKGSKVPGVDSLVKISKLGISINWLLNGSGSIIACDEYGIRARNIFIDDLRHAKSSLDAKEYSYRKIIDTIDKHYGSEEQFYQYLKEHNIGFDEEQFDDFFLGNQSVSLSIEEVFYKTNIYLYIKFENQELLSDIKQVIENIQKYQDQYLKGNGKADEILQKIKDIICEY